MSFEVFLYSVRTHRQLKSVVATDVVFIKSVDERVNGIVELNARLLLLQPFVEELAARLGAAADVGPSAAKRVSGVLRTLSRKGRRGAQT